MQFGCFREGVIPHAHLGTRCTTNPSPECERQRNRSGNKRKKGCYRVRGLAALSSWLPGGEKGGRCSRRHPLTSGKPRSSAVGTGRANTEHLRRQPGA